MQYITSFYRSTPLKKYADIDNILDNIDKNELDFEYLYSYMTLKQYRIVDFSHEQRERILSVIKRGFVRQCDATFYFTKSIQLNRTIYTNQASGNVLYVYDNGEWVLLTDYLKIFDSLRAYS